MTIEKSQFTGLILLSGVDTPGITQALFETLSPFAITVLDIEQVVARDRVILTVLIALNPDHREAIDEDLTACAEKLGVDIGDYKLNRCNWITCGAVNAFDIPAVFCNLRCDGTDCSRG